jgi:hypothetical protein
LNLQGRFFAIPCPDYSTVAEEPVQVVLMAPKPEHDQSDGVRSASPILQTVMRKYLKE